MQDPTPTLDRRISLYPTLERQREAMHERFRLFLLEEARQRHHKAIEECLKAWARSKAKAEEKVAS